MSFSAVVIGASAGGINALSRILSVLDADFPAPVIVAQHMGPRSGDYIALHLDNLCRVKVKEADEKEPLVPGTVYIAPADYHLLVEADETLALTVDRRVNFSRPSIDVLFETAAEVFFERLIGVILTGASCDGAAGLCRVKELGGRAVVQSPGTAKVDIMPKSAIAAARVDHILPLDGIGEFLNTTVKGQNV